MPKTAGNHWTEESIEDYIFSVRYDFIFQLEKRLEETGDSYKEFSELLGVSKGRVSQIMNNRENMRLNTMVHCARVLGLKLAIVAYNDGDAENKKGTIPSEIFTKCWEQQGRPTNMFSLSSTTPAIRTNTVTNLFTVMDDQLIAGSTLPKFYLAHEKGSKQWQNLRNLSFHLRTSLKCSSKGKISKKGIGVSWLTSASAGETWKTKTD